MHCVFAGFCEKLSYEKNIFEERYLKVTGDGILSWYKSSNLTKIRGAIQIRGVSAVRVSDGNKSIVLVDTQEPRTYQFKFQDAEQACFWLTSLQHYVDKEKLQFTRITTRN